MDYLQLPWEWFLAQSLLIRSAISIIVFACVVLGAASMIFNGEVSSSRPIKHRRSTGLHGSVGITGINAGSTAVQTPSETHSGPGGRIYSDVNYSHSDPVNSNLDSADDDALGSSCRKCGGHGTFQGAHPCPECGAI